MSGISSRFSHFFIAQHKGNSCSLLELSLDSLNPYSSLRSRIFLLRLRMYFFICCCIVKNFHDLACHIIFFQTWYFWDGDSWTNDVNKLRPNAQWGPEVKKETGPLMWTAAAGATLRRRCVVSYAKTFHNLLAAAATTNFFSSNSFMFQVE